MSRPAAAAKPRRRPSRWGDWRSVRLWEQQARQRLHQRHRLWLHGWGIGLVVVAAMAAAAHLQLLAGSSSLALRYAVTLGVGYLVFLLVLRWWAGRLVGEAAEAPDPAAVADASLDLAEPLAEGASAAWDAARSLAESAAAPLRSGGGGDFGGGGAAGAFDAPAAAGDGIGEAASEMAGGVVDAVGGADEGAVVLIPVLAVFALGCLVLLGSGWLLLLYFGADVLLAVAVEVAFGYVSARTAVKVARAGWLAEALRLTWKPLLGALVSAVLLGAAIDWLLPQAQSLPHAVELLRAR